MKRTLLTLMTAAAVLSSCTERQTEVLDNPDGPVDQQTAPVVFNANVADVSTKLTTDLTAAAGSKSVFTEGDQVGIFATTTVAGKTTNYKETPYGYQRTAETEDTKMWKAMGSSLVWQSMSTSAGAKDHSFYAFYPYNSASTTKEKVVLPSIADQVHSDIDLTVEDFKLIDLIAPYDFLVAKKVETDYLSASDRTPKVAGALDLKFDHALALIEVNVVRANGAFNEGASTPSKNVEINSTMITANTLTAKRTANLTKDPKTDADFWSKAGSVAGTVGITFATTAGADGKLTAALAAKPKAPWLDATTHSVTAGGDATAAKNATPAKFYFVTYPTPANTEYQFEINAKVVKNDNTEYVKEYPLSTVFTAADKFESGKKYTFTVSISDRALTVMDLTITDWVDGKDYPVVEI